MDKGTLYIVSAPSGAGKSSLIQALLKTKALCNTKISVSYTTRAPRIGEVNSKHYFFVNRDEFNRMIKKNAFLEYAEVFGNYYGTSRVLIEGVLKTGRDILLDIDWQGAQQVREKIPQSCSIFILPPSKDELNHRLQVRDQDSKETIARRMKQSVAEIRHYDEYNYLVINDNFDIALSDLETILCSERLRTNRQKQRYKTLISNLLEG